MRLSKNRAKKHYRTASAGVLDFLSLPCSLIYVIELKLMESKQNVKSTVL